jgi:hypothetical protein
LERGLHESKEEDEGVLTKVKMEAEMARRRPTDSLQVRHRRVSQRKVKRREKRGGGSPYRAKELRSVSNSVEIDGNAEPELDVFELGLGEMPSSIWRDGLGMEHGGENG